VPRHRRPSPQTISVLQALLAEPGEWRYGYELGHQVALKAGSLYPILIRLTERKLLEARWEDHSGTAGRPPRHLYRLTASGRELAGAVAASPSSRASAPARAQRRLGNA
jgi:DNA-binding PadR family transcriptional regulator